MSLTKYFLYDQRNNVNHLNYYYFTDAFTKEELIKIRELGDSLPKEQASVVSQEENTVSDYRVSEISWIQDSDENRWLFEKMAEYCKIANKKIGRAHV